MSSQTAQMERPARTISEDACSRRFAANPAPLCSYCGKPTTTGLDHFDCEMRSYGEDYFFAAGEIDRVYSEVV